MTIEGDSREYDLLASWSERLAKKNNNKRPISLTKLLYLLILTGI